MMVGTLAKAGRDGVLYPKAEALGCGGSSLCPGPCAVLGMDVRDGMLYPARWGSVPRLGLWNWLVSLGPSVVLGVDVRDWYTMSCAWVLRPKAKALGCEHGLGRLGAAWCLVWMSGLVYPPRWGCVPRLKPWVVMTARCLLGLVWCLLWMSGGGILCPA